MFVSSSVSSSALMLQVLVLLVRAVNEDLVDAGRKTGASGLRAQLKELFGRITSQVRLLYSSARSHSHSELM